MELGWLEDLVVLAECGSFSRAADLRHMTQPAFSRRIRALETWVGATLVDRTSHPIGLTEAGRDFRMAADEVIRRLREARDAAQETQAATASTLRFAATHSLSMTFFPEWLQSLEGRMSPTSVRLASDSMAACERLLANGEAQFLLCHHAVGVGSRLDPKLFLSTPVGSDVLVPVAAPGALPAAALPGQAEAPVPYLAYDTASGLGRMVDSALAEREVWIATVFVSHMAIVLRAMAREGRGMAWLPRSIAANDLARGTLVPAGDESWNVPVEIRLYRPRSRLAPAAEEFWALLD